MKKSLLIVLMLFLFISCDDSADKKEETNPCLPNPCIGEHQTKCVLENNAAVCNCDDGYNLQNNICVLTQTASCTPNPCTESHKTLCTIENNEVKCNCDEGFHNENNNCVENPLCNEGYAFNGTECVVICTEESLEGLNGYCVDTSKICVQGICVTDGCLNMNCPEKSICISREGVGFCECEEGYHMSENLCCGDNSSNTNGVCACDEGYILQNNICVPSQTNDCEPNPCVNAGLHKNTCVIDDSINGYHCDCNSGYTNNEGVCELNVVSVCPDDLICLNSYCVKEDRSNEQCLTDADCRVFNPTATTTCNPSAAGGICIGCTNHSDCPGNTQCNDYGTCAYMCDTSADCPTGTCYTTVGLCGQSRCSDDSDCFNGTVCIDDDGDGTGMCLRIPCNETACSEFNPNGTCANPNETCLYGSCVSSCSPNPCNNELFKTVCNIENGIPVCSCDIGYVLDEETNDCVPEASSCDVGFVCESNICVNRDDPGFQCLNNAECGTGMNCSPTLPSGVCSGCSVNSDCPTGSTCLGGYCLRNCSLHTDCNDGMICKATGNNSFCGFKNCAASSECGTGYVCSASGQCKRKDCY